MKRMILVLALGMMLLSACATPPANPVPIKTEAPALPSETVAPAPTETPLTVSPSETAGSSNPKLPAASFEAQTYINETAGFALEYPAGWTVTEQVVGPRGTQIQFLSAPELSDAPSVPAGQTRVNATIYQWDPKNDLAAFVANQKTAWEASGFTILEEEQKTLELGLQAVQFTLQTPEAQTIFLVTALQDQYLVLSGEGDLDLIKEIVGRVRPISP